MENNNTQQWAIVELMGHDKTAGRYTFVNGLHRIDVPQDDGSFYTQDIGNGAIFRISYVDEDAARLVAKQLRETLHQPISPWELKRELKRLQAPAESETVIEAEYPGQYDHYDEDEEPDYPDDDDEIPYTDDLPF